MKNKIVIALTILMGLGGISYATLTNTTIPVTKNGASNPPTLQNGSITDLGTSSGPSNVGVGSTNPGQTLDVFGTVRVTSSTTNTSLSTSGETATLGSELLSTWTATGWTNTVLNTYTHNVGNTTALTNSLAAVTGNYYFINLTVTTRTAGTVIVSFGGVSYPAASASVFYGPKATSTGTFSVTPTTDFDGTIAFSIKQISPYNSILNAVDSVGTNALSLRISTNAGLNLLMGYNSGSFDVVGGDTQGNRNTSFGQNALRDNTVGYSNTAVGTNALQLNTDGLNNISIGRDSMFFNTQGNSNNAIGNSSMKTNTTGSNNVANGTSALRGNVTGSNNTAIGDSALLIAASPSHNTAVGSNSLVQNSTGSLNTAVGDSSGFSISSGSGNTTVGYSSATGLTTGGNNTTIGYNNFTTDAGANNIALGSSAGRFLTGNGNLVIDAYDRSNIAGDKAGAIIIGTMNSTTPSLQTLTFNANVGIGSYTPGQTLDVQGTARISQQIFFPNLSSDAAATDATVCRDTTTGQLYRGTGTLGICLGTSTMMAKQNIMPITDGLPQLMALKPVIFNYRPGWGYDPKKPYYGFIAEQVNTVLPWLVSRDINGNIKNADYVGMIPVIVKSTQQEQEEIYILFVLIILIGIFLFKRK